jgi:DNA helicase-2/ATP-dependent DNA helicase PcrA
LDLLKIYKKDDSISDNSKVKIRNLNKRIAISRKWLENITPDKFFNKVIRRFKYLKYCLAQEDPQILNHLLAFYSEFKRLTIDKNISLTQFLERLELLENNKLGITAPPLTIDSEKSVQLLTVHRAKGLEFEYVFLIKVIDKKWGNVRDMSRLRLPYGILKYDIVNQIEDQNEDERRLFYVALTRAKKQIYISYSTKTNTNRDQIPSVFISEIDPKLIEIKSLPANSQQIALQKFFPVEEQTINQDYSNYLKNLLSNDYVFNVTHLNSYLRCPFCFYHQTVLRIPAVKDKFSSLGTAVHYALSQM